MAEGMFGLSPEEIMRQQQMLTDQRATAYGRADPFERANSGMYRAGAGLADIGAGMMGGYRPEVRKAEQMQQMQKGMDTTTPEGLMAAAKKFNDAGMTEQALKLVTASRDLALKQAQVKKEEALAGKYNRPGGGYAPSGTEKLVNLKAQLEERLAENPEDEQAKFALEAVSRKLEGLSDREQKQRDLAKKYGPDVAEKIANNLIVPVTLPDGSVVMVDKLKFAQGMSKGAGKESALREAAIPEIQSREQKSPYEQAEVPPGGALLSPGTKGQEKLDKAVSDLANDVDKSKLSVIGPAYENLSEIFGKYPEGKNIPGIGLATNIPMVGAIFSGEQGRQNRQAVQRVFNGIMAESAGLSQTVSEAQRQTIANALQPLATEEDFVEAWKTVKNIYNTRMSNIVKSSNPEVLAEYEKRTGNTFRTLPEKEFITKAKPGNKEESAQSRLDVVKAVKRGAISKAEGKAIILDMDKENIK